MAYAFDTLGDSKRPRDAGIPANEAETHAEAAREFIMAELVTRSDLEVARRVLDTSIASVQQRLENRMDSLELRLGNRMDSIELRLMVKLGGMIAGVMALSVAILAAIIKL